MKEVYQGIYQLPVPLPNSPLGHINAYLVRDDKGFLLVDTGWDTEEAFGSLKEQMAKVGTRPEEISRIVITHIHPDHYGLAGRLKHISQASIALHRLEEKNIRERYVNIDRLLKKMAQWLAVNGVPADELPALQIASTPVAKFVVPESPDNRLEGSETIKAGSFNFRVLWTPGHSPGHIVLYEPDHKILISGDHVLPHITPNVARHPQSSENPLKDYIDALEPLKELEVGLVLPGHEQPFNRLSDRIDIMISHHHERNAEILKSLDDEAQTAYQLARKITWMLETKASGWDDLSTLDHRLALLETISHLEYMRFEGRVDQSTRNNLIYYRMADTDEYS